MEKKLKNVSKKNVAIVLHFVVILGFHSRCERLVSKTKKIKIKNFVGYARILSTLGLLAR